MEATKVELRITEPIDIVKVTENIDEMTKKSCESNEGEKVNENTPREEEKQTGLPSKISEDALSDDTVKSTVKDETCKASKSHAIDAVKEKGDSEVNVAQNADDTSEKVFESETKEESNETIAEGSAKKEDSVDVEYRRASQEKIEIIKDIDQEEEICLRKGVSVLSRSDSFSVKEEIEKIERQLKALESKNATIERENVEDSEMTSPRLSIQANRRHFFENMVANGRSGIKIEFKELPREQKDIHVVRLTDAPMPIAAPREPVKVIELHISEPIKHRPELLDEVNPIPKPRRHSALNLKEATESKLSRDEVRNSEDDDKRGKSF